jgi:diaminohydroxyphosphoribosylaminopyrimidine deaminase/5-amino-6-(5-phosphoribosylamino)uracil reductase
VPVPLRIVLDSRGRVPLGAKIYGPNLPGKTITIGTEAFCPFKADELRKRDVEIITVPSAERGRVYLDAMVISLGSRGVHSIMVEGGSDVHGSFLSDGLVDEVWAFIAPSVIGGRESPAAIGGAGIANLSDRLKINHTEIEKLGDDILIRGIRSNFIS